MIVLAHALLGALALGPFVRAPGGESGDSTGVLSAAPERVFQLQVRELWPSATERIPDALLVVADGKIRAIRTAREADPALPLLRHEGVVSAGLIACRTQSGTRDELQDDTRTVLPGARAVHAFDPASADYRRALAAGITSLGLAPGPQNLVGGLACVVKTAGGRVVNPGSSLALSLSSSALGRSTARGGFLFGSAEGDEHGIGVAEPGLSQADGGPESSSRSTRGTRTPTGYAGALEALRDLFASGNGPFGRARRGELAVTIEAWDRHEILRALDFAREQDLVGAIRGAPLAGDPDVVAALKASGFGVILGPYSAEQTRPSMESLARLAAAGVPVAFAVDAPSNAEEQLRLSAVRALQAGASREAVWKALTEDAARLSGVAKATGKLAPGLDADFVLWSGNPLDLTSRVVAVYVDGERAWSAPRAR